VIQIEVLTQALLELELKFWLRHVYLILLYCFAITGIFIINNKYESDNYLLFPMFTL
jgi:hypothetical protein